MAVVVSLLVAVVIGIGLARSGAKSGAVAATVITLALLFVSHELAVNWTDLTGGDRAGLSFSIGDTLDSRWPIYVVFVLAIIGARMFAQSRVGRLAQAAREDNLAARAIGVDPRSSRWSPSCCRWSWWRWLPRYGSTRSATPRRSSSSSTTPCSPWSCSSWVAATA
ncbi:MAG: hypothetical protein GY929_10370 [Actinomycetia bacterium]|nr:hypothetical protein [Actinomycetes bacterium]